MLVKLAVSLSGSRNGEALPKRGELVQLPDAEAVDLLNARMAEAVPDLEKVEKAVAKAPAKKPQGSNAVSREAKPQKVTRKRAN